MRGSRRRQEAQTCRHSGQSARAHARGYGTGGSRRGNAALKETGDGDAEQVGHNHAYGEGYFTGEQAMQVEFEFEGWGTSRKVRQARMV